MSRTLQLTGDTDVRARTVTWRKRIQVWLVTTSISIAEPRNPCFKTSSEVSSKLETHRQGVGLSLCWVTGSPHVMLGWERRD